MEKIKLGMVLLTSGLVAFGHGPEKLRLFFDVSYPVAAYAQALDTCVQLCADFDEFAYINSDAQRELVADAILGKALRIRIAVDALINECQHGKEIVCQEREFLVHALGCMADRYHRYEHNATDIVAQEVFNSLALRVRMLVDHT